MRGLFEKESLIGTGDARIKCDSLGQFQLTGRM